MINILLVDDRFLTRQALQAILKQNSNLKIVGEADCGKTALEIIARESIDIAIVDLDMPIMDGFELTQRIAQNYPQIKVVILSSHEDPESINKAIECGARGYLIKNTSITEVVDTIDRVQRGYFQLGPGLFEKLIDRQNNYEICTNKSISNLKTKSQQDLDFVRQELFTELEREIERLKFELRQGLEDFEGRAVLQLKNSLENCVNELKNSQYSSPTWHNSYQEITENINLIKYNHKVSLHKLSKEIAVLRYCLIFLFICLTISFFNTLF